MAILSIENKGAWYTTLATQETTWCFGSKNKTFALIIGVPIKNISTNSKTLN
jgi:hypothetical protein